MRWLSLFPLALVAACSGSPTTAECFSIEDCESGAVCIDGTCQLACVTSRDCNPGDLCVNGVCAGSTNVRCSDSLDCDDGNACTLDACATEVFLCVQIPVAEGSACDDDGNECTDDTCDANGACLHTPNTGSCDDGNACTSGDSCAGGVCAGTGMVDCSDGNPCTDDACDPVAGCFQTSNTAPCDDDNECTTPDVCVDGNCSGTLPGCPLPLGCEVAPLACVTDCMYDIAPMGTECRGVNGLCDVAETCDGVSRECPTDAFVAGGTECRGVNGECDVPEMCDGMSPACPGDAVLLASVECRAGGDECNPAENCDGVTADCPMDVLLTGGEVCSVGTCQAGMCVVPGPPIQFLEHPTETPAPNDRLGDAVAVEGDLMVAGAPSEDTPGNNAGSAYVFRRGLDGVWAYEATLVGSDTDADDGFGEHLALSNGIIVVGACDADDGDGVIYVFQDQAGGWTQTDRIPNAEPGRGGWGNRLALSDGLLVVRNWPNSHVYEWTGSAFAYRQDLMFRISRLDIDGDWLIAADLDGDTDESTVKVFEWTGSSFTERQTLTPSQTQAAQRFGWALAVDGSIAVVGSQFYDVSSTSDVGVAYVFRLNAGVWQEEEVIQAADGGAGDRFGNTVEISGNFVVVGASREDSAAPNGGSAYVFEWMSNSWTQVDKLIPTIATNEDRQGESDMSFDGSTIVFSGEMADVGTAGNAGRVFIYRFP